uniref:Uncharacterized protein n=1 Tax=uncultured marine virus TaxID=186617 RepID=A0A0F7L822_9VIRU|nr:hypothetical protein [uncultured marine virus]
MSDINLGLAMPEAREIHRRGLWKQYVEWVYDEYRSEYSEPFDLEEDVEHQQAFLQELKD